MVIPCKHMDTIGKRVGFARKSIGMGIPQFAKALGLARQTVFQIENGTTKNPIPGNLLKIADLTGFKIRWLITGEPPVTTKEVRFNTLDLSALPPEQREALRAVFRSFMSESSKNADSAI